MPQSSFSQPVSALARKRVSCRTFQPGGLEPPVLERLLLALEQVAPPFATPLRPRFIDREKVKADHLFSSGTYGLISGVRHFLTAPLPLDSLRNGEDLGFLLETAVLHLTDWGIGSCWIGGVFDRKRFGGQIGLGERETLPVVIAIGKAADHRSLRERLSRWSAKGDQRKPFSQLFFAESFDRPLGDEQAGPALPALECLRRAPSASNKQPWRLVRQGEQYHLFLCHDPTYRKFFPYLQRIDMGIAMAHFQLAAQEAGLPGSWREGPAPAIDLPQDTCFVATWR